MKLLIFLAVLLSVFTACETPKKVVSDDTIISITHGTNFGHCRGYCRKEVIFTEDKVIYSQSGVDSTATPVKTEEFGNSSKDWSKLVDPLDLKKFNNMKESYGCPDCADGGSEYIEIRTMKGTKRVTIEYGTAFPDLEPLLTELRTQRKKVEN
ncbi:hypothetical protein [Fluviicola sp.]|uniref:hypothetical protein n=1 Tax=Fluviicola sp. TaxID=1917219 RepID=UPI0026189E34|nr:hypothetical protein [Fluviicola sp.]